MRNFLFALLAVFFVFFGVSDAADERLFGTWYWEDFSGEDGTERKFSLTLTFGADGAVKLEPFYDGRAPDVAYGKYEADGRKLRVEVTKIVPFFEGEESVHFSEGEIMESEYELSGDSLVMPFLGGTMDFNRVK